MSLDATIGGVSANSYVTLDEANDYFTDRLYNTDWDNFTDQESALVTASRMLDWYMKWKGVKADVLSPQFMDWPRVDVIDQDGIAVLSTIIPPEVKIATFELAFSDLTTDRTADNDMAGFSEVKVGPLMVKSDATSLRTSKPKTIPSYIENIVHGLIRSGNGGVQVTRLVRA